MLLIDNYDSFTFNLVQAIEALGTRVEVVRNDEITAAAVIERAPAAIVLSPGPGRPEEAGVCPDLIRALADSDIGRRLPVLGVCLGQQVLALAAGGRVVEAREPVHGKTSQVEHDGDGIFGGLPSPFAAMRYHSLVVDPGTLPSAWRPTARSADGALMGIEHRERPWYGVQFHPESVLCPEGPRLLANFLTRCRRAA